MGGFSGSVRIAAATVAEGCAGLTPEACASTDGCIPGAYGLCGCECATPFSGEGCANCPSSCFVFVCESVSPVCELGADEMCSDDPAISSLHGTCMPDGTCQCREGFIKNPATGRCL